MATNRRRPPAMTPEARENQIIDQAYDLAEKQISEGTASSQVLTHFLMRGSTRERLEKERLEKENELLRAKTESLQSARNSEALYADAIRAMRSYSGNDEDNQNDY
jgi:hypothetical protein